MRDRLIELIDDFIHTVDVKHWYSEELDEHLADYLLENGVIVPPCKVGDKIYVIYNNKIIKGKVLDFDIVIEKDRIDFCVGVNFFCGISMNKGFVIYGNAFITKEEAEKHLGGVQE